MIQDTGHVISVHKLSDDSVMTVSKEGIINFWIIQDFEWRCFYDFTDNDGTIIHSSLSDNQSFLAILKDEQTLIIYKIPDLDSIESNSINLEIVMKHNYKENQLCFCRFSQDEKYLAVALDGGNISVSITPLTALVIL